MYAAGTNASQNGKIVILNRTADTLLGSFTLGNDIVDFEMENHGRKFMVVTGSWGICILDSSAKNIVRQKTMMQLTVMGLETDKPGTDILLADIDDNEHVVVVKGTKQGSNLGTRNGAVFGGYATSPESKIGILILDETGNPLCTNTMLPGFKGFMDITISNDTVFALYQMQTTFTQNNYIALSACNDGGGFLGLPFQQPVLRAYRRGSAANPLTQIWQTWGFTDSALYYDGADAYPRKIHIGMNGNLLFAGETAGGNSVFRWDEKTTPANFFISTGNYTAPSTLVRLRQLQ